MKELLKFWDLSHSSGSNDNERLLQGLAAARERVLLNKMWEAFCSLFSDPEHYKIVCLTSSLQERARRARIVDVPCPEDINIVSDEGKHTLSFKFPMLLRRADGTSLHRKHLYSRDVFDDTVDSDTIVIQANDVVSISACSEGTWSIGWSTASYLTDGLSFRDGDVFVSGTNTIVLGRVPIHLYETWQNKTEPFSNS